MKSITIVLMALMLMTGCGDKVVDAVVNSKMFCIDGVEYVTVQIVYQGYMAPHFKPDGSLYTCGGS